MGAYIAAVLVFAIGAKMLYEVLRERPGALVEEAEHSAERALHVTDPTRGWSLVMLSIATSIDALAVGLSLGLRGGGIWLASLTIGLVAGGMSLLGIVLGKRVGSAIGRPAELGGAIVLMALGVSFMLW